MLTVRSKWYRIASVFICALYPIFLHADSHTSCSQKDASVRCENLPAGVGARYDRKTCFLIVSAEACDFFKIQDGDLLPLEQVTAAKPENYEQAAIICQIQHELTHRADQRDESNRSCSEHKAYTMSYYCMNEVGLKNCPVAKAAWSETECKRVCLNLLHNQLAVISNECLCANESRDCKECQKQCDANIDNSIQNLPEFCDKPYLSLKIDSTSDCKSVTEHYCSEGL